MEVIHTKERKSRSKKESKSKSRSKSVPSHIQYSLILPIPELEPLLQSYRFQYNFFAKRGIPTHITLLYLFDGKTYQKYAREFEKICPLLLSIFQKHKCVVPTFYQNPQMFALDFDKRSSDFIHEIQLQLAQHMKLPLQQYQDTSKRPHITIFTKRGGPLGFQKIPLIKKHLAPHLPLSFSFQRIWLLEINTRDDTATLVHEWSGEP